MGDAKGEDISMLMRWHGHACFELRDDNITIITDPHDGKSIGIPVPNLVGNIVLVSHNHFDHNCTRMVKGSDVSVIRDPIMTVEKGVRIRGTETFHDNSQGAKRGKNTIFSFELDGINFCHLGDLGHPLDKETMEQLMPIDVLFIPVGNIFTLDVKSAIKLSKKINAKIIVPMHYRIGGLALSIRPVDDFLAEFQDDEIARVGNEVEFKPEDLPEKTEIWVFSL